MRLVPDNPVASALVRPTETGRSREAGFAGRGAAPAEGYRAVESPDAPVTGRPGCSHQCLDQPVVSTRHSRMAGRRKP